MVKLPTICQKCNLTYCNFRTGYDFGSIRSLLWVNSENPNDWKHKRRRTVLGLWHEIKKNLWKI